MILFWFLSNCGLVLTNDSPAYSPDMLEVSQPVIIENKNELRSVNSVEELDMNKNAYQRSWFWEISQKSDRSSDMNKGPNHIFPKSMLKELAQHGVDISRLEYSRPPGGYQRNTERGINTGIQKWEETMIHPDTGKDVIVIPFTFQEDFPEKDIIRGYLMDMNSGRFSNCQLAQSPAKVSYFERCHPTKNSILHLLGRIGHLPSNTHATCKYHQVNGNLIRYIVYIFA